MYFNCLSSLCWKFFCIWTIVHYNVPINPNSVNFNVHNFFAMRTQRNKRSASQICKYFQPKKLYFHSCCWSMTATCHCKNEKTLTMILSDRRSITYTSQLSRIRVLSIGQPPPSLKTLQIELVNDSHSVRSTSRSRRHCRAIVVKLGCFWSTNFWNKHQHKNSLIVSISYLCKYMCYSYRRQHKLQLQALNTKKMEEAHSWPVVHLK